MLASTKHDTAPAHHREPSFVSVLSGWAQQGVQSFFAAQRILLDLAMKQNANVMHALREQLSHPHHSPATIFSEVAGEGMSNFIEGQKVLLQLGKQQNNILMTAVKERVGDYPAVTAMTDLLQGSVENFVQMQEEFLKIASKQTHTWTEAAKSGKVYQPEHLLDLARDGMENFVRAQKRFLDLVAEQTAKATADRRGNGMAKKIKKTTFPELARQASESLIDAQKKLVDVAGQQMHANVKTAGKALELLRPFPFLPIAELTREGVKSYVDAQKALMEMMAKPAGDHKHPAKPARRAKRPVRMAKKEGTAAVA